MNGERRNDVGSKALLTLLGGVILAVMSFAVTSSLGANDKANANKVMIKGMEVEQRFTREAVQEIKLDIREIKQAVIK